MYKYKCFVGIYTYTYLGWISLWRHMMNFPPKGILVGDLLLIQTNPA